MEIVAAKRVGVENRMFKLKSCVEIFHLKTWELEFGTPMHPLHNIIWDPYTPLITEFGTTIDPS